MKTSRSKVLSLKLSQFSPCENHHGLHLGLHHALFKRIFGSKSDDTQVIAVKRRNGGPISDDLTPREKGPHSHRNGTKSQFAVVVSVSDEELRSQKSSKANILCTETFLTHYSFTECETVDMEILPTYPVQRVVIGAKSERAFTWAKSNFFSTGLLLSACQKPILIRTGDVFLVPYCSFFSNHKEFSMDILMDLIVLESVPVAQGVLTVNTEIVIIQIENDENTIKVGKDKTLGEIQNELQESPVFASDFISCMQNEPQALLLEQLSDVRTPNKVSPYSPKDGTVIRCQALENFTMASILGIDQSKDFNNIIGLSLKMLKRLGLFEGSLIEVSMEQKQTQKDLALNIQKQNEPEQRENDIKTFTKNKKICQRIVQVVKHSGSGEEDNCVALPGLLFNITGGKYTDEPIQLSIKKYGADQAGPASSSLSWYGNLAYATDVHVSLINSPHYNSTANFNTILHKYFTITRFVQAGDILCLDSRADPDYNQDLTDATQHRHPIIYFKVTKVISGSSAGQTFMADLHHTNLYQDNCVHEYVPVSMGPVLSECHNLPAAAHIGLRYYVNKLLNLTRPHLNRNNGDDHTATILLNGPAGCGKSIIAQQVALKLNMQIYRVNCHELCGETSAATESRIKAIMHRAVTYSPCVMLLKNIQAIGKDREGQAEDPRVGSAFHELLDQTAQASDWPVVFIATSNNTKDMNADLQEGFLHHVEVQVPDESVRREMLEVMMENVLYSSEVSTAYLAQRTAGAVFGDLQALLTHAQRIALQDIAQHCVGANSLSWREEEALVQAGVYLTAEHFHSALDHLQAAHSDAISAPKIPNVKWEDVGGLIEAKADILDTIQLPLQHPELLAAGLRRSGVLLYGPPGTGKTLLAKAVATECSLNFLSVKGPELINMYVGQSEENVREVFQRARSATPCVIFFDELDSLAPNRGRSGDSGGVMDRVVSQLLAELDGMHKSTDVFVIGATNRPDLLDPALLRPGRFDKLIYLGVSADRDSQLKVIQALTRKFRLEEGCELERVVENCPSNLTGADFYALCSDAMTNAVKRIISKLQTGEETDEGQIEVREEDFLSALQSLVPSVSQEEMQRYKLLHSSLSQQK